MSASIEQRNQDATLWCGNLDEKVEEAFFEKFPAFRLSEEEARKLWCTKAGQRDHLDLMGPTDPDVHGNTTLMVSRDDFLDWPLVLPMLDKAAETAIEKYSSMHPGTTAEGRFPEEIACDNGGELVGPVVQREEGVQRLGEDDVRVEEDREGRAVVGRLEKGRDGLQEVRLVHARRVTLVLRLGSGGVEQEHLVLFVHDGHVVVVHAQGISKLLHALPPRQGILLHRRRADARYHRHGPLFLAHDSRWWLCCAPHGL